MSNLILDVLGLNNNNQYDNLSINQGQEFLYYQNLISPPVDSDILETNNEPGIYSITEGMSNRDSTQSPHDGSLQSSNTNSKYNEIENNFNKTLTQYSKTSDLVNQMVLNNKSESKKIPQELWDKLKNLNNQLTHLSYKLTDELDNLLLNKKDNTNINKYKNSIYKHLENLNNDKKKLHDLNKSQATITGMKQNSELKMKSTWLHYTGWLILSIIVLCILLHTTLSNKISNLAIFVLIISCILGIYYIYNIIK